MFAPTADSHSASTHRLTAVPAEVGRRAVPGVPLSAVRPPWTAIALSAFGIVLMALIGAAAPNDHTLDTRLPLLALPALPGPASTYLTCAAISAQGLGLLGLLGAARRGWCPRLRHLLAAGAAATALLCAVTPVGSADVASYAAYGRIAALGADPYTLTPAWLGGPYAQLVSSSWLHTSSVYGPVATWIQQAAGTLGGERPWLTIWLLVLANGAAYLATGLLLVRIGGDRVRAALLWAANPLLIGQLVAGAHVDTYVALFGAGAVYAVARARRSRQELLVGVLLGLGCGVKISTALLAVGLSWPLLRRRDWLRAALRLLGCLAVLGALYLPVGTRALAPLGEASQLVSVPSLWQFIRWVGTAWIGAGATQGVIGLAWPVLMLLTAFLVHRRGTAGTAGRSPAQLRSAHALTFGWILAAPWCMPWYTALVWPLAALLPHNRSDRALVWVSLALALVHNTGGHGWTW